MVIEGVVEVEARPEQVAAEDCLFGHVVLEAPAPIWLVLLNALKEEWIEWCTWQVELFFLLWNQHVAEVQIAGYLQGVVSTQSLEGFIASDLVRCSHLVCAHGSYLAISLDCMDYVVNSIDLCQLLWRYFHFLWLANVASCLGLLRAGLTACFASGASLAAAVTALLAFFDNQLPIRGTEEEARIAVNELFVLVVQAWHLLEGVVI